jgi:hypothetical protein
VGVEPTHKGFADLLPARVTRSIALSDSAKRANGPESGHVGFAKPTRARRGLAGIGRPDLLGCGEFLGPSGQTLHRHAARAANPSTWPLPLSTLEHPTANSVGLAEPALVNRRKTRHTNGASAGIEPATC